jgi:hypothetical protein
LVLVIAFLIAKSCILVLPNTALCIFVIHNSKRLKKDCIYYADTIFFNEKNIIIDRMKYSPSFGVYAYCLYW